MNKKILAFIYNKKQKEFLILKTKGDKLEIHGKSHWFTTTGSVENKESYEEAVKREVLEETGLEVKEIYNLKWGCRYKWQNKIHEELYFMAFIDLEKVKLDNIEVIDYQWRSLDSFVNLIDWEGNKRELKSILKLGAEQKIDHPWTRIDDYTSNECKTIFINNEEASYLTWYNNKDFSKLKNVKQIYGICFDNLDKICIINVTGNWTLPGGTPEKGESFEQTLMREVDEEADIEIKNIKPIGYNKIEQIKNRVKSTFYQLRYIANIVKIKPQTIDPAHNKIPKRKFISPEEFLEYCPWGKTGEKMINEAVRLKNI
ncbi:MAG: NUDIX hydrolase [Nanoarchaeota archaeon]|nr:NUDIX hydrolase [Nanoarchaeota archaeon]